MVGACLEHSDLMSVWDDVPMSCVASSVASVLARSSHFGTSETTQAEHVRNKCSPADSILQQLHGSNTYVWHGVVSLHILPGHCWMSVACLFLKGIVPPLLYWTVQVQQLTCLGSLNDSSCIVPMFDSAM